MSKKKTLEEVVAQANTIHNFKYDYSKSKYDGANDKTIVICEEHGEWLLTWSKHLNQKSGCPKCWGNAKKTLEEVVAQANTIHNFKYDYSKSKYINNSTKTIIICPEHGEWEVTWGSHLNSKSRCPKCALKSRASKRTGTLEEAIFRANIIHDNKYNYSKSNYESVKNKTIVICPEHGEWGVRWNSHLNKKSGCPKCAEINNQSRYLDRPTTFYYLKYKGLYKIGITTKTIKERYTNKDLNNEEWEDVEVLYSKEFNTGGQAFLLEQLLRNKYIHLNYQGTPIFRSTGNSEIFIEDILGVEEYNTERQEYFEESLKLAKMNKKEYIKRVTNEYL